jgi:hypothetical protein
VSQTGNRFAVVLDGTASAEFDGLGRLVFSPDSKQLAYAVKIGGRLGFAFHGKVETPFDSVGLPRVSQDGNLEFLAVKDGVFYSVKYIPDKVNRTPQHKAITSQPKK